MKLSSRIALILVLTIFMAGSVLGGRKHRKLPIGAYIKTAKIEILSGEFKRYENAISYLDSLFLNYGHHAEGLSLMSSIYVDYIDKTPGPINKRPYVKKLVAYVDTLHMTCKNKEIKKDYRKDCDEYTERADSTKVKFWRQFYNAGIEQLTYLQGLAKDLETTTDSAVIAFTQNSFQVNIDSCIANMELAIMLDPSNTDPYIAVGNAYEYKKDFHEAVKWLAKGLEKTEDKSNLLISIAYDYVRINEYCEAIPYFKEYSELNPTDEATLFNLSICYTNCKQLDAAYKVYNKILELNPENYNILGNVGNYFNQKARYASDSAKAYREAGNVEKSKEFMALNGQMFDSSGFYFKKLFEIYPDSIFAAEQYAVINAIRGKYDVASIGFEKLTVLDPDNKENWTYLGDCYLNLKEFKKAIPAYEKVIELDPTNKDTMERLRDLYIEIGDNAKKVAINKKINEL
ncbi:MAG: hypothetical protein DRP35_05860 [Candidatus Zixiibacteriota bacterium]|nr:MAG: hypothetical protein DRP35_05860 [candidate division Zixibacteria bacterium]